MTDLPTRITAWAAHHDLPTDSGVLADGVHGTAVFSPDHHYRYALTRTWDPAAPHLAWVMLNPSTASGRADDNTLRRIGSFSRRAGAGGLIVANLFALRATDPSVLPTHADPVGEHNDAVLAEIATDDTADIVAGWGAAWGHLHNRAATVTALLTTSRPLRCLGTSKAGHPRHPLRLHHSTPLRTFHPLTSAPQAN